MIWEPTVQKLDLYLRPFDHQSCVISNRNKKKLCQIRFVVLNVINMLRVQQLIEVLKLFSMCSDGGMATKADKKILYNRAH